YLRTGQDQFGDSLSTSGGNGFTGRVTRLAWYDEEAGRSYLHLGGDYYLNVPPKHVTAFRSIPEIFVGQNRSDAANSGTSGFAVLASGPHHRRHLGRRRERLDVRGQLVLQSVLQGSLQLHPFLASIAHFAAQCRPSAGGGPFERNERFRPADADGFLRRT